MVILNNTNCLFEYTDGRKYLITTRFKKAPAGYFETKVFDTTKAVRKPIGISTRWCFTFVESKINHKELLKKYNLKTRGLDHGY